MKLTKSEERRAQAQKYIDRFLSLDHSNLGLDPYNVMYLEEYASKIEYNVYLADFLLNCAGDLNQYDTLIDYGGGIGFNSGLFASLGLNLKIIYVDIDPVSKASAESVHKAMGIEGIEYMLGGIEHIERRITPSTLICSRDVIEHVYDLKTFFSISGKAKRNVHNTAAILDSFFRSKEFRKIHSNAEYHGSKSSFTKSRDSTLPYAEQRKSLISTKDPNLSDSKLEALVTHTRGLIDVDIQRFVSEGVYPENHIETLYDNCCDPLTGNWAERTLSQEDYIAFAENKPLRFVYPKYNELNAQGIKKIAIRSLNIFAQLPIHSIQPSFSIVY